MGSPIVNRSFARLFKKYRLRSEIETLTEFGDLLAEEGFVFDNSIFTHWQKGTRVPNNRRIILTMIRIFFKKHAISTQDEINEILATLGMRDLTIEESIHFFGLSANKIPFNVPEKIDVFTGRNKMSNTISSHLLLGESVAIYGQPGSGKTSLIIQLSHNLRNHFYDGVLWFRADIQHIEDILIEIGQMFSLDISKEIKLEHKAKYIHDLLLRKSTLLILDNVDGYSEVRLFMKDKKFPCATIITSRLIPPRIIKFQKVIQVKGFNEEEFLEYARKNLGNAFLVTNLESINEIGKLVEFSPLILSVLFKQIEQNPKNLEQILNNLHSHALQSSFDLKIIQPSLDFTFDRLATPLQNIFVSLGIFNGSDFSIDSISYLNNISNTKVKIALSELRNHSLVEMSTNNRYRIHPLIKAYLQTKIDERSINRKLSEYYLDFLSKKAVGDRDNYVCVIEELDNIKGIITLSNKYSEFGKISKIWDFLGVLFWDTGRWEELNVYSEIVRKNKSIFNILIVFFTLLLFLSLSLLWVSIFFFDKYKETNQIIFATMYVIMSIWGGTIGLFIARKWGGIKSIMGKSIGMFSLGLLFQSLGQIVYSYYVLFFNRNEFPYPSLGDIGYFGSIFLYIYGSYLILTAANKKHKRAKIQDIAVATIIPLGMLSISYFMLLKDYILDWNYPLIVILDFGYPLGQSIYLFFALLAFVYSKKLSTGLMKRRVRIIIFALISQYIADYVFIFMFNNSLTKPGDIVDYLYLISYFIMTCALIQFRTVYGYIPQESRNVIVKS